MVCGLLLIVDFDGREAIVLVVADREVVVADEVGQLFLSHCLADVLIGMHVLIDIEMLGENTLSGRSKTRSVFNLFE